MTGGARMPGSAGPTGSARVPTARVPGAPMADAR
jgi:hypothetical protein